MSGGQAESLLGEMDEDVAVGVEDLGFGDKAEVSAVLIDDGQVPGTGVLEYLHHFLHRQVMAKDRRRRGHELTHRETFVETGLEHDIAHLVQQQDTAQAAVMVDDGEDIALALGDHFDQFAKGHLGEDNREVGLQDVVHLEESEDVTVFVVGEQFAFLRQTHGVERVGLEKHDGQIGDDADDHQWHEKVVAARQFGDEEDAGEWNPVTAPMKSAGAKIPPTPPAPLVATEATILNRRIKPK